MAAAAKMFNLMISPWPELGVAWQAALDRYEISNSRLLLWLLWSVQMPTRGRGAMKGVLTDGLHISLRDANAVRVVDEATVRGMTVRSYVLTVICARLKVAYVEPKRCGAVRGPESRRPMPPPRKVKVAARTGRDAAPTQPQGGPYWPAPWRPQRTGLRTADVCASEGSAAPRVSAARPAQHRPAAVASEGGKAGARRHGEIHTFARPLVGVAWW